MTSASVGQTYALPSLLSSRLAHHAAQVSRDLIHRSRRGLLAGFAVFGCVRSLLAVLALVF